MRFQSGVAFVVLLVAACGSGAERLFALDVVINELLASNRLTNTDEDGDSSDWVEIRNVSSAAIDLSGWTLSDDPKDVRKWEFPSTVLAPGSHLLVWCSAKDRRIVSSDDIEARNSPLLFEPSLLDKESSWRYLTGAPDELGPPAGWHSAGFDDTSWSSGQGPIGFGADEIRTVLPEGTGAVFLRARFTGTSALPNLVFEGRWDDGFVAWINGSLVRAEGFDPAFEPTFASLSERSHSSRRSERLDLGDPSAVIEPGENVLAVALLNQRVDSADLFWDAELGHVLPNYHTSFRLSAEGGVVLLAAPDGSIADLVSYPEQRTDHSYGLDPDAPAPRYGYFALPTPGRANQGPAGESPLVVADTVFSVDRGFYDEPFDLEITTATPGATIRYTLDGTVPDLENGESYTGPIRIERTICVRASAFLEGYEAANVDTQSYIFTRDVVLQDRQVTETVYGFPRAWGGTSADYGMDAKVIGPNDRYGGKYAATIEDDLKSLPTLSIVLPVADLFGSQGIYTHSESRGIAWERAASVELIDPDGEEEFQIDCGLRIQGGAFRSHGLTKKHSFRLVFKEIYGAGKLEYPFFGDFASDRLDTITLRSNSNDGYQWDAAGSQPLYIRDSFGRETVLAMGGVASHERFVHLYLNGVYWGLYDAVERPDHSFCETYFGGDKDDWDAISNGQATNGDQSAWNTMLTMARRGLTSNEAYFAIQGRRPDGTRDPSLEAWLDVDNLIDYMIVNLWVGNTDWPHKNWWIGRDRDPARSTGFKFFMWDSEWSMGIRSDLQTNQTGVGNGVAEPYGLCRRNEEFRVRFGDRLQRTFFDGGALAVDPRSPIWDPEHPEQNRPAERFVRLANAVESAMVAESARWGDQHTGTPYTRDEHWRRERDRQLDTYLPRRSEIVLSQFQALGLYPRVAPPIYSKPGGEIEPGFTLSMSAPLGEIYYTSNGVDPRMIGGDVHPGAVRLPEPERVVALPEGAPARFFVPTDAALGLAWIDPDFNDSAWESGATGFGFDVDEDEFDPLIGTDLETRMAGNASSLYLRIELSIEDPSRLVFPLLRAKYDDGWIAWLNGELLAAVNADTETVSWDSVSTRSHADFQALEFEDFDLTEMWHLARPGKNVLAVQVLNRRATDDDLLFLPLIEASVAGDSAIRLDRSTVVSARARVEGDWSALVEATFIVPSERPFRVTELMYHPAPPPAGSTFDASDFEFVEIVNAGDHAAELAGVELDGAIEFTFTEGELAPGEHLVLVKNLAAFETRYDTTGTRIDGEYDLKLSNAGERLRLRGPLGETILDFRFDDGWYPSTDGEGHSLVIARELGPREAWSDSEAWLPSRDLGGSPGFLDPASETEGDGGRQVPGDVDQDGRVTISDPVTILRRLFGSATRPLPCEASDLTAPGNVAVHDIDGDAKVSISDAVVLLDWLFRDGVAPRLGTDCVPIRGCGDVCGK